MDNRIKVLFACVENSFRSQIAQAVAEIYFHDKIEAFSAGSKPIGNIHRNTKIILSEMGVDVEQYYSKGFNELPIKDFDYLITMGCNEVCPIMPSKKHIMWNLPDIKEDPIEKIRQLKEHIKFLIKKDILKEGL